MRNKISGVIGMSWGGFILINNLLSTSVSTNDAYLSGQQAGVIFGALLLIAGLYYFFKKPSKNES